MLAQRYDVQWPSKPHKGVPGHSLVDPIPAQCRVGSRISCFSSSSSSISSIHGTTAEDRCWWLYCVAHKLKGTILDQRGTRREAELRGRSGECLQRVCLRGYAGPQNLTDSLTLPALGTVLFTVHPGSTYSRITCTRKTLYNCGFNYDYETKQLQCHLTKRLQRQTSTMMVIW